MANEAQIYIETGLPIPFTCSNSVGIERGTILKMTDPFTCAASDGNNDIFAGIAATEKIANDGKTKIAVYREGIFIVTASGAITVGDPLVTKGSANLVITAAVNQEQVIGIALETATEGQTFLMELNPTVMQLA
jgi:hypothetical protein